MKLHRAFYLVLVITGVLAICVPSAYAAVPYQQVDDPVQQCAEGHELFLQDKYTEALPLLEAGFNRRDKVIFSDTEDLGYCALELGILRRSAGNPNGALEAFQVALEVFRTSDNRNLEGITLDNLGYVFYPFQGQYAQALDYFQQALSIWREVGDRAREEITLHNLGYIYSTQGQYTEALNYYQQALAIEREEHDRSGEGTTLNNIGLVYSTQGNYAQALDYFQQALVIRREVGEREGEGQVLSSIGFVYASQSQYAQALDYFQQALVIAREVEDRSGESTVLNNIGGVYNAQGQYKQALNFCQQALTIVQEVNDRSGEGTTLQNIGEIYFSQGQYTQALGYYQQALTIVREIGDWAGEGMALNNIGQVYDAQGHYAQALGYQQQALVIARKLGDRAREGESLNNLGSVFNHQGQYAHALDYYQQALAIARELGYRSGEGTALDNLGQVYDAQGQYAQALEYYQQALAIRREVGDRAGEGRTIGNLGLVYDAQSQYTQALECYQQALAIAQEVGDQADEGARLNNLGTVYQAQGQSTQALDYYKRALAILQEVGDKPGEGITLNNLGYVYDSQGQYAQALNYYQQALVINREVGDRAGESITLANLGYIYRSQGQSVQALEYYQQSIAAFEDLRSVAGNDAARTSFTAQYADLYRNAAFIAHQLRQDDKAFALSEQGRARSFLDALTTGVVELSDQAIVKLVAREQDTYINWLTAQDSLSKAQNSSDATLISRLKAQLAKAEHAHTEAVQAIEGRGDELAALVPGRSTVLSLTDIQALLDDQTTLVSYFVIDDKSGSLAFIFTHNSFSVVELPMATPANLKAKVEDLTTWPSLQDAHPQPLRDLYTWLIFPLKDRLKTPRVGVIAHLTLHYIPFAALTDGRTYFGEQYQLFELPSGSSLRYIQQRAAQATNTGGAVVIGNPATKETGLPTLPYAAAEADAVATILGVNDYTDTAATELQLREVVSGTTIVHLAAHGAYNQYNPLYSALYLATDVDGEYDGRLEVHEIFGLNLKGSQLVVLSACETQLGQLSTGDEVVGMTRAFMFAGAPSVLASLWRVDDEATQTLMTAFYKHWREEGMDEAQALQAAQADVRANPKWQSPYYWSAFVLNGYVGATSIQSVSKLATEPAKNATSTPTSAPTNPSGPICSSMILAPFALITLAFATKRRSFLR